MQFLLFLLLLQDKNAVKIGYITEAGVTVSDPNGENAKTLESLPKGEKREVVVSPDGRFIAVSLGMMGLDLHVAKLDGSPAVHLSKSKKGFVGWSQPTWSPDSKKIVCAVGEMFDYNLWVVDADGGNPKNLTQESKVKILMPAWSPDGSKIAYIADPGEESGGGRSYGLSNVWIIDRNGSGKRQLTRKDGDAILPRWSPDSRKILYTHRPVQKREGNTRVMGGTDVWCIGSDGGGDKNLTNNNGKEENSWPAWSPDGKKIALIARKDGGPGSVYVMDADGSNVKALLEPKWGQESFSRVQWSPDGSRLIFQDGYDKIMFLNADGSGLANVGKGKNPIWVGAR